MLWMVLPTCHAAGMTSDARTSATPWAARWGRVLAGVSIGGTILAVLSVFLLTAGIVLFASEMSGAESTWWYWLVALGFAAAGVMGLVLTSAAPSLAYLLRLAAVLPMLSLGFASAWLMAPAVVVGAADLSLMVSHWTWARRKTVRGLAGLATTVILGVIVLPVSEEFSCENPGDPVATCEAWYGNVLGWSTYEEDQRNLVGWGLVAVLGGLIVALPVTRDTGELLA